MQTEQNFNLKPIVDKCVHKWGKWWITKELVKTIQESRICTKCWIKQNKIYKREI